MSKTLPNYLKTYRRKAGLTQDDMAYLLGCNSGAKVSRYEHFKARPSLTTALAYQTIFRIPAKELFPGIYQKVENEISERVRLLSGKLSDMRPTAGRVRRLDSIKQIITSKA